MMTCVIAPSEGKIKHRLRFDGVFCRPGAGLPD